MGKSKESNKSFISSIGPDDYITPKLESLGDLVNKLNSELHQKIENVDPVHGMWQRHNEMGGQGHG